MNIPSRESMHNLFADHCDLIANDVVSKLRLKRREINMPEFCIDDLRTQDDVLKQLLSKYF